ncbi:hypothetical protein DFQ28_011520 [Apophysomyces sp. BC1034]|nr:hypothetical protein DFQ30_011407 [Apophysomyces sp. BC1015]KAG0168943.1 hypothetical protein DFQ29_009965 [Apophysomyces sp. BC1021]KAG0184246.1 hypothetical protein DFQ28_011520 [Apophysomyces sp. BC1034]
MSSKDKPTGSSALSTAVNDLIRAAAGGDAQNVADEDLDKYIANVILKEAEAKRKKYNQVGVRAYQPDTGFTLPKPNKRFLLNVVRATDSHNQAVLRTAEEQARKARRERRRRRHRGSDEDDEDHDRFRTHKRQRSEDQSLSPRGSSRSSPPIPDRSRTEEKQDDHVGKQVTFRGRGKVKLGQSAMDKYFDKRYDPAQDIESDVEEYVWNELGGSEAESKKKHKKKKEKKEKKEKKSSKKKKKKRKREEEEEEYHSSGTDDDQPPSKVRAWDVGKSW